MLERAPVPPLLDDGRADVRRAGDGRGVAELVADPAHHRGEDAALVGGGLGRPVLGEGERRLERPAPGAEVLRRVAVGEVVGDVLVEDPAGQVGGLPSRSKRNRARAAGIVEQGADRLGELGRRRPSAGRAAAAWSGSRNSTPAPSDARVALRERRDAVRPARAGVPLRADAEPRAVDERDGERARPVALVRPEREMRGDRLAQPAGARRTSRAGRTSAPPGPRGTGVVEVLPPPGAVDARSPGASPRGFGEIQTSFQRGDHEALDARQRSSSVIGRSRAST